MKRTLLLAFVIAGCSVDQTAAPAGSDLSASKLSDLASVRVGDLASSYPAGPYGHTVGDTIWPLAWEGYADPLADAIASSKAYGPYSMNDLRLSGRPYAAIHVSEFF